MINLSNFLDEIEEHFRQEYPREGCGVLALKKGKLYWIPCTNTAFSNENFQIDFSEYTKIKRTHTVVGIVHSHPDASCKPSQHDINSCNFIGIPYYIFSYPEMEMFILSPEKNSVELYGRDYKFGVTDCFEAARDYYQTQNILLPERELFEDDWWLKGLNYFSEEKLKEWKFSKVKNPQRNDLLVFSVSSKIPNHCGVYIGNDLFFHHAVQRLSCKEHLYPFWVKSLTGIYRYEA